MQKIENAMKIKQVLPDVDALAPFRKNRKPVDPSQAMNIVIDHNVSDSRGK